MTKIKKYFLLLLLAELLLAYTPAYAQQLSTYDYTQKGTNPVSSQIERYLCAPTSTSANSLYDCINRLYKFAIIVASVLGVLFLVIAGYIYMSAEGNNEAVEKAKNILTSTVTALVILLGGYVLLKAINPDLIRFQTIQPPTAPMPAVVTSGAGGTSSNITEQDARTQLASKGITVNAQPPKTTLVGIQQSTLNVIFSLKQACSGCQIIVTGGTEPGHSETGTCTHANGYKVDLATNTNLDNYIKSNFKQITTRSDGALQWQSSYTNAIYALETTQGTAPHWDVSACQ